VNYPNAGGGFRAIFYMFRKGRQSGGYMKFYRAMRSKNACKTCALGMGGQLGGMVNESGHFPEVCKKSIQAMAADMQGRIPEEFFATVDHTQMRTLSPRELETMGRLTKPLYAGPLDKRYREISWEEALTRVSARLGQTAPDESFFYVSGRSSNEAGFLLQVFARVFGTNNVNNCSYYCHQASGVGLSTVTGSGTATIELADLEQLGPGDVIFLIGANPASNHPRLMTTLANFKGRGGKVVVVNPLRETGLVKFKVPSKPISLLFGTRIADEYIQPHIGGDIAFLTGLAKAVIESEAVASEFISSHTDGWEAFLDQVVATDWGEIEDGCGVPPATIRRIAALYEKAPNAVFCWAMGITHHANGVENVQAIANLAMIRGMLGRPKAGLLPLRGHSNVQGIGSVGVTPQLKTAFLEALESQLATALPRTTGLDTMACMVKAAGHDIRFALCLGGNLYGSNPDSDFARGALAQIDMVVYLSTTLNTGHAHGLGKETIILPVLARDEEPQATTQESMFNYVRLSDGGPARHEGPRAEISVIADIAERTIAEGPVDWRSMREYGSIRQAIARVVPGYGAIADIDSTGREFHIDGRTFHQPRFKTDSGRARFHAIPLPHLPGADGQLRLMTVRSEGQFNTVVYEEADIYRGQDRRDIILMNQDDIDARGLSIDQPVTVKSASGAMTRIRVRVTDIPRGNAVMYYPEANLLVGRAVDPKSRTPAFKATLVTVEAQAKSVPGQVRR
jgi:molybdopterin-dependent oxidoreductase alpha subunit